MAILGALGGVEAGRHLLEALHDPSQSVREAAFFAMARLPAESLKDKLGPELHNADPRVRGGVAALLGKARAADALEGLVAALFDPEEEVRVNALNALAGLGLPVRRYQNEISARLSDPSARVREVAAAALEALREAWAEAPDPSELLRQGTLSVAGAASLLEMVSEGSFDPLLRALESNRSAKVLGEYFSAAGRGALGSLLASLHQFSENDAVRARTALACGAARTRESRAASRRPQITAFGGSSRGGGSGRPARHARGGDRVDDGAGKGPGGRSAESCRDRARRYQG